MPLDAITLGAVIAEIQAQAAGVRIEKIYQPEREEIVLQLRASGFHRRLLIAAGGSLPRLHFTQESRENPAAPPMFCMLLRKHLQGGRLCSVTQPELERMAVLEVDTLDEMGVAAKKYLICELMGRHSNLILMGEDGRIIDALKRFDGGERGGQQVLPGLFYRRPPAQDKQSPLSVSLPGMLAAMHGAEEGQTLDKWLVDRFLGISPLLGREISYRATGDVSCPLTQVRGEREERLMDVLDDFCRRLRDGDWTPTLVRSRENGQPMDFSVLPMTQYGERVVNETMTDFSALLCAYCEKRERDQRQKRRGAELTRLVKNALERARRKYALQQQELAQTENREQLKRMGDLITANLYQIEQGMKRVRVVDYYQPDCPEVEIGLDLRLSPQQNAQKYYKRYQKAKTARQVLAQQLEMGEKDMEYLESVLAEIAQAENESDLEQIRQELQQTGYLTQRRSRRRVKMPASKPFVYETEDGFRIYAGKNNVQNDLLTLKTAHKNDIWFHTQKIHGSHVILSCAGREPTEHAMTRAAQIAAYHSRASQSAAVPVDYTPVKYIKKPAGARPGMVIYHVYQTAFVTPQPAVIEGLRVKA